MNKYSRVMNKAFSLLALICLALMQVVPSGIISARPTNDVTAACGGQTDLLACIPDGSDATTLPDMIQVFPAAGGPALKENPNDTGGLQAHVGDTIHVPFEFADLTCGAAHLAFAPTFNLNPLTGFGQSNIQPTKIFWPAAGNYLVQGTLGPGNASTVYGYFEFVVQTSMIPPTGYLTLQVNSNTSTTCGANPLGNRQYNITDNPP